MRGQTSMVHTFELSSLPNNWPRQRWVARYVIAQLRSAQRPATSLQHVDAEHLKSVLHGTVKGTAAAQKPGRGTAPARRGFAPRARGEGIASLWSGNPPLRPAAGQLSGFHSETARATKSARVAQTVTPLTWHSVDRSSQCEHCDTQCSWMACRRCFPIGTAERDSGIMMESPLQPLQPCPWHQRCGGVLPWQTALKKKSAALLRGCSDGAPGCLGWGVSAWLSMQRL